MMPRLRHFLMAGLVLAMPLIGTAASADDSATKSELQQLRTQLQAQKQRMDALEGLLRNTIAKDVSNLRERVDAVAEKADGAAVASWPNKVKLKGDFRYRHEMIDEEKKDTDRHRHRFRMRIGIDASPTEDLDLHFRMVSGSDDPVSTNQSLDGGFSSKGLWIDRAYADYHPDALGGAHLLAGKMGVPFFKPGKEQLIWDGDLSIEGIALKHSLKPSETTKIFTTIGAFWVEENSSHADNMLYAAQLGVQQHISEDAKLTFGASCFRYTDTKGSPTFFDNEDGFGNSTEEGEDDELLYLEDYHLVEGFAQLDFKAGDLPISLYGDYVKNIDADSSEDTGWLAGIKLGKAKKPGTWQLGYNYRVLEADAVIGAYSDSDFNGGGTGGKGHKLSAAYQINKAAQFAVTYLINEDEPSTDEDTYRRLQLDFKLKF